jgi:integrase
VDRYENEYLVELKPSGVSQKLRLLKRWMPAIGDRPVSDIREADILTFINELLRGRANGRTEADHLVGVVRNVFTWAKKQHDPAFRSLTNPALEIASRTKVKARDRVLTHQEIGKLWDACDTVGWPGGSILKLLLLTAQRVNEVAQMRWSELDLDNKVWILPAERAKNSRAHIVHLSDFAMEIIEGLPQINGSPVFTMNGTQPFTNLDNLKRQRIDRLMSDAPHWQIRDLRRTSTTLMAEIGIAPTSRTRS